MSGPAEGAQSPTRVEMWTSGGRFLDLQHQPELVLTSAEGMREDRPYERPDAFADGTQYRLAPLFAVLQLPDVATAGLEAATAIVVGHTHVSVDRAGDVRLHAVVARLWRGPRAGDVRRSGGWHAEPAWDSRLHEGLRAHWRTNPHVVPATSKARATRIAKALAESSRNSVMQLRERRYDVDRRFGMHLRRELDEDLELVLADMAELQAVVGRARDTARYCVRSGLQHWINDAAMYHAQRRRMDTSLPVRRGRRRAEADRPSRSTTLPSGSVEPSSKSCRRKQRSCEACWRREPPSP